MLSRKFIETFPEITKEVIDKELLMVGFAMTNIEALKKIQKLWTKQRQEIDGKKVLGRSKEDTQLITSDDLGGAIILLNPECVNGAILGQIKVKTPMGLHYSKYHKMLFTGSDHWIYGISQGKIIKTLNNQYFNCIHSLAQSHDCKLLVVSTGIDAVLKIDIDNPGELLNSWFATENGYSISANGEMRYIDRNIIHQGINTYSTPEHTTHINSVFEYKKDKLLATFFHQGELVEIDMRNGKVKVIISGLTNPHGIRKASFGYLVSDTNGKRVIRLNNQLEIIGEITGDFNWIQDAIELDNGNIAIADANNGRIVIVDPLGNILNQYVYGVTNKRVGVLSTIKVKESLNIF